ncbi:helix-turn-helix transcriptional regulator [Flavobacterium sp.]|jgi:excisionase family DNA binding protein|uniref:helix-turn-helix transcriptional regulator n=1 Tax=Flavobacterium sp. TaxID=239 RepID=UPI002A8054D5|nr:helix-turn-helix domain-containing protein [Flavobacterium sp.]
MEKTITFFSEEDLLVIAKYISENIKKELQPTSNATTEDQFLSIDQLAELITLTKPTIYGLVYRKTIPYIKKGRMLRFSKHDILNWLQSGKNQSNKDLDAKANVYLANNPLFKR